MFQEFLDKGITEDEIRMLIDYRDGNVTCGMGATSYLEQYRGYTLLNELGDDCLPRVEINGNKMSTTEAYCYERYHQLKKKICDKLGVPYYVQLDLDWMLTTYFHQPQDKKEVKID